MNSFLYRSITFTVIVLLVLIGCGQKVGDTVYNTDSNPEKFPGVVLTLLNDIESGELNDFETISSGFGELYVSEPDLLDNQPWQKIVNKLGQRFSYQADSLVEQGVEFYSQAGGLYTLASFAQPEDKYTKAQAALFSVWQFGIENSSLAVYNEFKGKDNLRFQLGRVRHFMEGDSLQAKFAKKYLIEQVLAPLVVEKIDEVGQLDNDDKGFLKSIQLIK